MFKETVQIVYGALSWKVMRIRFRINYKKVILVLVNENRKLDYYAMVHLKDYMQRKYADEALILYADKTVSHMIRSIKTGVNKKVCQYPEKKIRRIYRYYSFFKFFDNIVFTYTTSPKDNQLGRVLKETQVNEEEAVCLGLYQLRKVPEIKETKRRARHV